nr:hypothetical protein GCM10020093_033680 [Planobispora longispora]
MESLKLGSLEVWPPVVLAPMAGITNAPFRTLCREQGGGLFVCEMITTRALVERNAKTLKMIRFAPEEKFRSIQLYGSTRSPSAGPCGWSPRRAWPTTSTSTSAARCPR